jgi:hypothetical protein
VLVTIFTVGLATRLGSTAPTRAAATLYFGIIGIAGHGLVPLGLGASSAVTVLAAETPLAVLAAGAYLPSLMLAMVFRIWAGIGLWRGDAQPSSQQGRPSDQTTAQALAPSP